MIYLNRGAKLIEWAHGLTLTEELPTAPVKEKIYQIKLPTTRTGFEKFNFAEVLEDE